MGFNVQGKPPAKTVRSATSSTEAGEALFKQLGQVVASRGVKRTAPPPTRGAAPAVDGYVAGRARPQGGKFGSLKAGRFANTAPVASASPRSNAPTAAHIRAAEILIAEAERSPRKAAAALGRAFSSVDFGRDARGQLVDAKDAV